MNMSLLHQALFSMNMFIWDAPPGGRVVSHRFWIYWALTVPITLVIVVAFHVFVWTYLEADHENEAETPFQGIKRRRTERLSEKQDAATASAGQHSGFRNVFSRRKKSNDTADNGC